MARTALIRYGAVPDVERFHVDVDGPLAHGARVVVRTRRGMEMGTVLEMFDREEPTEIDPALCALRPASAKDEQEWSSLQQACQSEFDEWVGRIDHWKLELELIDLEWTFDRRTQILYVLNDRGPDCTRLAIQAAAAGLGTIEVQPVGSDGPVHAPASGGCGSGCDCHAAVSSRQSALSDQLPTSG